MQQTEYKIERKTIKSMDGTIISYKVIGKGPGLVIIHGAFRGSQHYIKLAKHLSNSYKVYILDRRGRNYSGPKGNQYSIQKECEDIFSLLKQHEIQFVFGHSFGAIIALHTALQYPFKKIAVYEPPLSLSHSYLNSWLPQFEHELGQSDYISASVTLLKGLKMGGLMGKLPKPILKVIFRSFATGPDWEENAQLLLTVPEEIRAFVQMDSGIEIYRSITTPTMVISGTKSPEYLQTSARELESTLPNKQSVSLPKLDHNAPDEKAPDKVAQTLKQFFV